MKLTKRKQFSFLRSYFDVLNELEEREDKLDYLLAIINKQFLNEEPQLKGLTKLAYVSQQHAIDKSVKGYIDKMKTDLKGNPLQAPTVDPCQGGRKDPCQQEKEKEKEEEKEKGKEKEQVKHWNESIGVDGFQIKQP